MTQSNGGKPVLELDVKWLIGILLSFLGLQASVLWRVVALHERIASVEVHITAVETYDATTRSADRLARVETQLDYLTRIAEDNNRRIRQP